jgi:acyl-CoA thioester hydrolase
MPIAKTALDLILWADALAAQLCNRRGCSKNESERLTPLTVIDPCHCDRSEEPLMFSMSSAPFEMIVSVLPADIDDQKHVNNTVYLRWVQEVATAHWRVVATAEAQEKIGWVVLRHEIDYKAPACPGDRVVLRTWVGKATRLTFERFTEMLRGTDRQLLSNARTLWCPVNARTGRPIRVPPEVREQFSI